MKTPKRIILLTALCLWPAAAGLAASIGVNFLGDGGNIVRWQLAPTDTAGVVVQANWNNISTIPNHNVGLSDLLLDNTANYTAVQLRYEANDAWNSDGGSTTPNEKLMKGLIKEGNGEIGATMFLSFTNLPPGTYDLYVYGNVNMGPVDLDVSVETVTNYWTEPAAFDEGTGFVQANSADPNARGQGNYVKFAGVSPVSGAITLAATYQGNGGDGLGIAGLQLVTAGTFPSNTVPVSILQQPQSTVGAPAGTATFLVWAGGPGPKYQWYKNGTLITGATASSYTTPALHRSDDGARYKVTVYNNVNSVTSTEAVLTVLDDPLTRVATVGVSFLGDGEGGNVEPYRLARSETAGVLPQTNWNNVGTTAFGNVGSSELLLDNISHCTGVQLQFNANDAWNSDGPTDTPNDKLMKGLIKEGNGAVGSTMTLTFTNVVPAFYDVYVYGNVNGGPVDLDVSIGPVTNYWTEPAAFDDGTGFVLASSTNPNIRAAGNYVKFTGVTPASRTITIVATYQNGSDGLGIAGVQLAASAAFPTNTLPVAINGQPRAAIAAPGGTATFLVWADGPFASYQWFRNGVLLPGATSSAYTTPPVTVADNGAQYRVTVANNVNSVSSDIVVLTVTNDPATRVASLGVSFLGNCDDGNVEPWRLNAAETAGVVPQANWNNLKWDDWGWVAPPPGGFVGLSAPLTAAAGNLTAVQVRANCNDAWNSDGATTTPNEKLMKGVLKQGGEGSTMTLTFTNLPAAFYDAYVYGAVNGGPVYLSVSVGELTNYWFEPAAFDDASGFMQAASTDPNAPAEGNYVRLPGVTPASGQIIIRATYLGGSDGLGVAGVQLVSSAGLPPVTSLTPRLGAAMQGGQLVLSWSSPGSFQLQSRTNLTQGSWIAETTPPVVVLEQHTVQLPASGPVRFFRLIGR